MDQKSYTLEELESHVKPTFSSDGDIVPLSPLRLKSYLRNPLAEKTDHVLFEMWDNGKLVAYRTLLPDRYIDQQGNFQRFAWLSGNYVDPGFRRRGISTRLLQLAEAHWDGRLIYTNYAPASRAVYDHSGQFPLMSRRMGKRFYLRSATRDHLGDRLGGLGGLGRLGGLELLGTGDQMVNKLREGKLQKFQAVDKSQCQIERITSFSPLLMNLIEESQKSALFPRNEPIFSWILEAPWLTTQEVDLLNYQFTYRANRFENLLLSFTLPGNSVIGLLWLVIHNQKLTVPYVFANHKDLYPLMATTILRTMITHECAYTTIRHSELLDHLQFHKKWFLSIRNMPQNLFAHKKIIEEIPGHMMIQDGDGDVVFTG